MGRRRKASALFAFYSDLRVGRDVVGQADDAAGKGSRVSEVEHPSTAGREERNSAAEQDRDYGDFNAVNEPGIEQAPEGDPTAEEPDGFAWFAF